METQTILFFSLKVESRGRRIYKNDLISLRLNEGTAHAGTPLDRSTTLFKNMFSEKLLDYSRTCAQQDDLIIKRQLGEMWDPLRPLHQGKQLFVCSLTDVGHCIVGLQPNNIF